MTFSCFIFLASPLGRMAGAWNHWTPHLLATGRSKVRVPFQQLNDFVRFCLKIKVKERFGDVAECAALSGPGFNPRTGKNNYGIHRLGVAQG